MTRIALLSLLLTTTLAPAAEKVRVACVGDSITFGAGVADRKNNAYPVVLGKLLGDGVEVRNFGFSARTMLNKGDHPFMKEKKYPHYAEHKAEHDKFLDDFVDAMTQFGPAAVLTRKMAGMRPATRARQERRNSRRGAAAAKAAAPPRR